MSDDAISTFFDAWELYDRVLDNNCMLHEEIHRDLAGLEQDGEPVDLIFSGYASITSSRRANKPFSTSPPIASPPAASC